MDVATLTRKIATLSVADRVHIFDSIWASLSEDGWQPEITDAMRQELDRRSDSLDANPSRVLTWEQIESYVRKKK